MALPVTHAVLAGGAKLWWSPLQHPPVGFACDKLHLVGEVPPFDSEFTTRGSLTRMQSGTPSKLAEGDFFMQFWQGGARLQQSPLQHPPVRFTRGKLHLVREVSPFDSEFTTRGSLTRMQSGTPSKLAEGDFFMQFWQGGARLQQSRLQQSPLQHPPVRFTRGKLHLVREVSPFDSEFTTRRSLTRMQSGTLSKSAEGDIFRRVIVHFLKNTCLRTMECLHCELKAFSDCAYIYA